ncbi:hypothetical protein B5S28_g5008 [[Candida] boidinii]|uniref:Unnamed protein product n=1 Tax=Candida boidinii TaxID=5477 RepID=A0ACB5TSC9_CANBO|nr:hypothetical protein B5S28_g5008 [[Candida] boidinii]OWB63503.1 hypothetical protein B5S29_g4486 [[Candida] boidinii]OWB75284.1 hypothetical protein B5S31_g5162 [[Candida] boidinii]OWB80093.1 hypothetical protein B5S32_g4343 [[Candida] boidinii]GME94380.1 unnamed protein product [[Candida] boidinii]
MNPALTNLVLMLVNMQVARRLDFEDPTILLYVRIAYVTATVLVLSIYLYVRSVIISKNDLTTLKYVEPSSPLSGETGEKLQVTTVKDYDLKQINSSIKGVFTGLAMMGFMHIYMKYTNPLFMQTISPIKSALEANIVKIHLFGKPATGDLKRPFKAASLFGGLGGAGSSDVKTDKASIEKAETSGAGGIKEE